MEEKQKLRKKLRSVMAVMAAVIIPGLLHLLGSSAFDAVRAVDIALLFAVGVATGVLIATAINYLRSKDNKRREQ